MGRVSVQGVSVAPGEGGSRWKATFKLCGSLFIAIHSTCVRMNLYVSLSMGNRTEQVSPDQCDGVLGLYAHVHIGMRMPAVV